MGDKLVAALTWDEMEELALGTGVVLKDTRIKKAPGEVRVPYVCKCGATGKKNFYITYLTRCKKCISNKVKENQCAKARSKQNIGEQT